MFYETPVGWPILQCTPLLKNLIRTYYSMRLKPQTMGLVRCLHRLAHKVFGVNRIKIIRTDYINCFLKRTLTTSTWKNAEELSP